MQCWHFLTLLPELLVLGNNTKNVVVVCLNDYRVNPQVQGCTVVAFHQESIRVSLFIFSRRMAWCNRVY
jgi:hypothetical protein